MLATKRGEIDNCSTCRYIVAIHPEAEVFRESLQFNFVMKLYDARVVYAKMLTRLVFMHYWHWSSPVNCPTWERICTTTVDYRRLQPFKRSVDDIMSLVLEDVLAKNVSKTPEKEVADSISTS